MSASPGRPDRGPAFETAESERPGQDAAAVLLGPMGEIVGWSVEANRRIGCGANDAVGRMFASLFSPVSGADFQNALSQAAKTGRADIVGRLEPSAGESTASATLVALFDRHDAVTGFAVSLRRVDDATVRSPVPKEASPGPERRFGPALDDERAFADTMLESMPGIVYFYDTSGKFLRWNRNFENVSGYSASRIARMHPLDFFGGDDKTRVKQRIAEVFETGESSVEANFISRDGKATPYFFTGRRVRYAGQDCLVGMGIDISDRRRAEDLLADSERKYRELVQNANSIILQWSRDGRITFLNDYGLRFFGYSADEILGRHVVGTIVPQTDVEGRDLAGLMDEICADPEAFEENVNENVRRDGTRAWISWTNRIRRDENGAVSEILSIGADITARIQASEERERRYRAEQADRIKSSFLATMSHELRTPLNSIIGFTGIILQGLAGPLNEEQDKQLTMVRDSARHLLALVNDVLDISKIEAGQFEVAAASFDLRRSIEKVVDVIRPQADGKGLAFRVDLSNELGCAISDERRFEQILLNLLGNAVKFTQAGEITLSAEPFTINGPAESDAAPAVRIRVADTGMGIRDKDMQSLFQPFKQIDTGIARKHEGTGLGLAICRRLAELMGGEVSAESQWTKGSVFTLVLPIEGPSKA